MNDYWPTNTKDTLYIPGEATLGEMLERVQDYFGVSDGLALHNFNIHSEHIHTHAIGYDLYDSSDYTNFIVITKKD